MPEATEFDERSVDLSQIDFTDLEQKYHVNAPEGYMDKFIVCDGTPVAPESKAPILKKVLGKLFSQCGKIVRLDVPVNEGKTTGYVFVEYANPQMAQNAVKHMNGKKLDVKHRLLVNKLTDVEKYVLSGGSGDEFVEPEIPKFESHGYLKSFLKDPAGRDQYLLHHNDDVGVFWFKKGLQPEPAIEPRSQWTSAFMKWSPKGSYLFSLFPNGVQCWGGASFDRINRFFHRGVRLVDCSPNEKFLVTLSPDPITLPPEDHPARGSFPFSPESEGHKLVIWEIQTGLPVKTFALPPNLEHQASMPWPLIKWSYNDKYCARMGPDALAVYDVEDEFTLLEKKLVKIPGILDFQFAPGGVKLAANRKSDPPEVVLSFWTPESSNQSARASVMQIPSRNILRTVNLVQVSDCQLFWQGQGKYLCCRVNRHTKSKKTRFTNLQVFQLEERDIPVESIDLKDVVVTMAWEPKGQRFVTLSQMDSAENNPAFASTSLTFYDAEEPKKGKGVMVPVKRWIAFKTITGKYSNVIKFSPMGRFVIVATMRDVKGELEFYDLNFDGEKSKDQSKKVTSNAKLLGVHQYQGLTNLEWEVSGRFVAGWSSSWKHKIENGYKIYDCIGRLLKEEIIDGFKEFEWRPRPASLLSKADKKKVRKSLREYSAQFEEDDAMEANAELREQILRRKKLLRDWRSWRKIVEQKLEKLNLTAHHEESKVEVIEEIKEVVLEEKEEIIE
ncbi:DEKNAAC100207 [Brettanomyces naardenensis]|uniref:Eukaryotic translation initiation factor 3 subunit B n=1 Tax=Brettanomyces naardenensis TaxID=13370 RepID=A0A448YF95_BRENA|nr:DEKNAAC100207 [Brettanomyces naardenensis]